MIKGSIKWKMLLKNIVNYSIITKGIYVNAQGIIFRSEMVLLIKMLAIYIKSAI